MRVKTKPIVLNSDTPSDFEVEVVDTVGSFLNTLEDGMRALELQLREATERRRSTQGRDGAREEKALRDLFEQAAKLRAACNRTCGEPMTDAAAKVLD